ncbi:hypothetical protein KKD62_02300 [Patescibacteria group bacterium]|nr:hypothetical protein [Patescibacteria group bacterium]
MTENGLVYYATINNLTQNGALEGLVEMDESQLGQDPEDKIENGTPAPQEPPGPDREQAEGGARTTEAAQKGFSCRRL